MERVTLDEAQERLAELIARVVQGEAVIIEAGDQEQIQLVRLPIEYLIGEYGIPTWMGRRRPTADEAESIYRPYALCEQALDRERAISPPREFGSAAGLISMSDDFDEPLELVPSRLVDKYPELRAQWDRESGAIKDGQGGN